MAEANSALSGHQIQNRPCIFLFHKWDPIKSMLLVAVFNETNTIGRIAKTESLKFVCRSRKSLSKIFKDNLFKLFHLIYYIIIYRASL